MAVSANINRVAQLGVETTPGTPVAAVRRLQSTSLTWKPKLDVKNVRGQGKKFDSAHYASRKWSEGSYEGGLAFNEVQYFLSSAYAKSAAPVQVVVGSPWAASTAYALGVYVRPTTPNGHIYKATVAGTSGTVQPTWPLTAGATVTDGTVTWTEAGSDASGAWEWIFDIPTSSKSDIQTYTGERGDMTQAASAKRVAMLFFNGLTIKSKRDEDVTINGSVTARAEETKALTTAGIVEKKIVPASPAGVNVYVDSSSASLGTTKITTNFSIENAIEDRFNTVWYHNRDLLSFADIVEIVPKLTTKLDVADDAGIDDFLTGLEAGTRKFVRFESRGPEISAGVNHLLQWDIAAQVSEEPDYPDEDLYYGSFTLAAEHDETWGRATRIRLITNESAL